MLSSDSQFGLHTVDDKTENNIFYELLDYDTSSFIGDYRRFVYVVTRCLHPQSTSKLYFVDGGSMLLQNRGNHTPKYTMVQLKRTEF